MFLTTDSSETGWGAHRQDLTVERMWDAKYQSLHISYLELQGIFLALKAFLLHLSHKVVLSWTDNMTAMYYLQKCVGGGSSQVSAA